MMIRRCLGLLLLLTALLATARLAPAQPRPRQKPSEGPGSHVPIPKGDGVADPQKLFEQRLREMGARSKDFKDLQDTVRKMLSDDQLKKLVEQFKKQGINPNDPAARKQIEELIKKQQATGSMPKMSPEDIERLQKMVKNFFPDGKLPDKLPPDGDPTGNTKPPDGDPNGNAKPPDGDPNGNAKPPTPQPNPVDQESLDKARKQLEKLNKQLGNIGDKLKDSPALQEAVRDMAKSLLDMQNTQLPPEERLDAQLANLNRFTQDTGDWFKDSFKSLKKFDLPDMPKLDMPTPNWTGPNIDLPNVPMPRGLPGAPGVPGAPGGWQVLLVLFTLAVLALTLWKLWGRDAAERLLAARASWKLGPWPIHPGRIASREDLIRAYEYLSMLRFGYPARTWNHLAIASQLGSDEQRRQAAAQLATLYEQVRYAPGETPLSAEALAAARRDLCFLAGVAAV